MQQLCTAGSKSQCPEKEWVGSPSRMHQLKTTDLKGLYPERWVGSTLRMHQLDITDSKGLYPWVGGPS